MDPWGRYRFDPALPRERSTDPRPLTLEIEGRVMLIPTVRTDGSIMSAEEAVRQFFLKGVSLGSYANRRQAERAAGVLAGLLPATREDADTNP